MSQVKTVAAAQRLLGLWHRLHREVEGTGGGLRFPNASVLTYMHERECVLIMQV